MTDSISAGAFRGSALTSENDVRFSKVPEVALGFWIIKILATTLGETGGDAVTMSLGLGYAVGTLIFLAIFLGSVAIQVRASRFNAYVYWLTIVATTTLGTTIADFVDRSLGLGYLGGSSILLIAVVASLAVWRLSEGTVSVSTVATPRSRGVLLDHHLVFADPGNRAWGLDGGHEPSWVRGRRSCFRRGDCIDRRALSFHASLASRLVLDGLHPYEASWGDAWRPPG